MKLKSIDINSGKFEANGKTYYIESELSFERYRIFCMLQIELGFDVSFAENFEQWKGVLEDANKLKFADIVIRANNMITGVKDFSKRPIPAISICALFCNTENEDRKTITEKQIEEKHADWAKEGYNIYSFFDLASISVLGLRNAWNGLVIDDEAPLPKEL